MTTEQTKQAAPGRWASIAPEVRPSAFKNADGSIKPFYLSRRFDYLPDGRFELEITNYADAGGNVPLVKMNIRGHVEWRGPHPVADGAQHADFTADEAYDVTPLHAAFVDVLNRTAAEGYEPWETGRTQSILKKAFAPFGLADGQLFKEYDLIYIRDGLMFWGARHVDGRGFDTEANRPAHLQIPMQKLG